jgi:hypothetical protein
MSLTISAESVQSVALGMMVVAGRPTLGFPPHHTAQGRPQCSIGRYYYNR